MLISRGFSCLLSYQVIQLVQRAGALDLPPDLIVDRVALRQCLDNRLGLSLHVPHMIVGNLNITEPARVEFI